MTDMVLDPEDMAELETATEELIQLRELWHSIIGQEKAFITKLYGDETVLVNICEDEEYEMEDAETHEPFVATLLMTLRFRGKYYAVFSAPNNCDKIDILALRVGKDAQGYDELLNLTEEEKEFIGDFLQMIMARGAIDEIMKRKGKGYEL